MGLTRGIMAVLIAAMILVSPARAGTADATQVEIEQLKQDLEILRRKLHDQGAQVARSPVDKMMDSKYGPDAQVTTRNGKLTIGGLLQVWYYSIENDSRGIFDLADGTVRDSNQASDNDSFRIRRAELSFTMEVHENITAHVMIDPAREAISFPDLNGGYKRRNQISPEFRDANDAPGSVSTISNVQFGAGGVPNLLQDAFINYHGVVPHHDFTVGQYLPLFGEEGPRSSAQLDFVERSFIGNRANGRDLGATIHGSWWGDDCDGGNGRFQYWLSAFNSAGNYHGTAGQAQNRGDDNDAKDFLGTILVRPVWDDCGPWGHLELGYSGGFGKHGEAGNADPFENPVNGLNRQKTWAIRHAAWIWYRPGGPVKGLWFRGEYQSIKDRNAPGTVLALGNGGATGVDADDGFVQTNPNPFTAHGWYAATGYKFSESRWAECGMPSFLQNMEIAFRYQAFDNVEVADLDNPAQTDNFKTQVWTAGLNYYIKGHNAKIQLNYNRIDDPNVDTTDARNFHSVHNDNFVVNFQVAF